MTRLFDKRRSPSPEVPPADRLKAAVEAAALDENARRLGDLLGASRAVKSIEYARDRRGRWLVEHGRAGDDYVFQLHPLKAATRAWQDVITGFIAAMDTIFPRTVQIHYRRPDEEWQVKFFTVRVDGLCRLPGWEPATKKAVDALSAITAWADDTTDRSSLTGRR